MMDRPRSFSNRAARKRRPTTTHARAAIIDQAIERALVAILETPPACGETLELAFRRKEHSVGEIFAVLPTHDARLLHRRLSEPTAGDRLADLFHRLVVERRTRLLAFLGDARRREALALVGRS